MAVTAERARDLALALPGATEAPHMDRTAFRTPRKIFATLGATGEELNLMLGQDLRDFYCEQAPRAFQPIPGGWGRMGWTRCALAAVEEDTLASALAAAHRLAAPHRAAASGPRRR
ncbi:MAG: MmcQ/YjbR family DNA-binding protein [Acetobacteraceae bacterium]|nr:MmcQ/YjbR family DNA-binding protein [Acetobacteraceae bacterium]